MPAIFRHTRGLARTHRTWRRGALAQAPGTRSGIRQRANPHSHITSLPNAFISSNAQDIQLNPSALRVRRPSVVVSPKSNNSLHPQANSLRRRRSSTSLGTSPLLNAIKSPAGKMKARSRSHTVNAVASEGTSLFGRIVDAARYYALCSCCDAKLITSNRPRQKRSIRHPPAMPPPTCPLPAPPQQESLKVSIPARNTFGQRSPRENMAAFFGGVGFLRQGTIEEEMKEN